MKVNLVKKFIKKVKESEDKSINRKNKKLMMDKILSYSPDLVDGIDRYKDANRNFMLLMFFSVILINFPIISLPCCVAAVAFLIRMLQFIKYKNINTIVNILGKDIAYKGIYDKGKIQVMLEEFEERYGKDTVEYKKLVYMVDKYEAFITKIEYVISKMKINKTSEEENKVISEVPQDNKVALDKQSLKGKVKDYYNNINDKFSLTYKNEEGEIKKINRAIEFFDNKDKNQENSNTVVLKSNRRGKRDKLTVYLYKKSSDLQNDVL